MKPILLLDIDGVCLPFDEVPEPTRFQFRHYEQDYRIPETIVSRVVSLFEAFDVTWCTAWEKDSIVLANTIGLPKAPYVEFLDWNGPPDPAWKLPSVIEWVRNNCPERALAWIDDDIAESHKAWAEEREHPTLLVQADPNSGISSTNLQDLLDFAAKHTA